MGKLVIPRDIRDRVHAMYDGRCAYCGAIIPRNGADFHVDHILPLSRGGPNDETNMFPSCAVCNCSKGDRSIEEWRENLARKLLGIPYFSDAQRSWLKSKGFVVDYRPSEAEIDAVVFHFETIVGVS